MTTADTQSSLECFFVVYITAIVVTLTWFALAANQPTSNAKELLDVAMTTNNLWCQRDVALRVAIRESNHGSSRGLEHNTHHKQLSSKKECRIAAQNSITTAHSGLNRLLRPGCTYMYIVRYRWTTSVFTSAFISECHCNMSIPIHGTVAQSESLYDMT